MLAASSLDPQRRPIVGRHRQFTALRLERRRRLIGGHGCACHASRRRAVQRPVECPPLAGLPSPRLGTRPDCRSSAPRQFGGSRRPRTPIGTTRSRLSNSGRGHGMRGPSREAKSAEPSWRFTPFNDMRLINESVATSASAQLNSDSAAQPDCHALIHRRASSAESARRTCQRWMSGSANAATTAAASTSDHGRRTAAPFTVIEGCGDRENVSVAIAGGIKLGTPDIIALVADLDNESRHEAVVDVFSVDKRARSVNSHDRRWRTTQAAKRFRVSGRFAKTTLAEASVGLSRRLVMSRFPPHKLFPPTSEGSARGCLRRPGSAMADGDRYSQPSGRTDVRRLPARRCESRERRANSAGGGRFG